MDTFPANLEDCLQPNMEHPSEIHPQRDLLKRNMQRKVSSMCISNMVKKVGDISLVLCLTDCVIN